MSVDTTTEPRVWIGCLACYNEGNLIGEWFDADTAGEVTIEQVHEGVRFGWGGHEELWVMDHEGFGGMLTGECSPAEAQQIAEAIGELDQWQPVEAVAAYLANTGDGIADLDRSDFDESYCGEWSSIEEYAENLADDIGAIDANASWPLSYIDWERAARDLVIGGDNWTADAPGGIYVFRSI